MVTWAVGAVINIFGSILINGGTNVMKLGHNMRSALEADATANGNTIPPIRKIRAWQIGVALFIVGNLMNFGSFAFAAQSLLAALGSVQFLANVAFGRLILKEPVTRRILVATALIIAGCVVLVSFGNHTSESFTSQQLQDFYKKTGYITYLCMMFVGVGVSYSVYRHGNALRKRRGQSMEGVSKAWHRALPISYSIFAALLGTQSVLFSKALSLLLRTTISGNSQLGSWFVWLNLVLFIVAAAFWVTRLNMALRLFEAAVIVPVMQICWTLFSIINGMIYYQEYQDLDALKGSMFALGVLIVFVGVYVLTNRQPPPDPATYIDLQEELVRNSVTGEAASMRRSSSQEDGSASNAQLGGLPEDDERFPLSPSRAHQRAQTSRRSPDEKAADGGTTHPAGKAQAAPTHHRRGSSLFTDLVEDFSISLSDTRRQLTEVAEHPVPPYAWPGNTAAAAGGPARAAAQRDVEMGRATTAKTKPAVAPGSSNPFAGGLPAADYAAAAAALRQPGSGEVLERPSLGAISGQSDRSESAVVSPAVAAFGRRSILSDDEDAMSPTWDAQDDGSTRRISNPFAAGQSAGTSTAKAVLSALSPRGITAASRR
jgi:drug/metabolite transporter (DMT)-like permease